MKTLFVIFTFSLIYSYTTFAQISTKVDERFELTSMTFALAGVPEFCDIRIPSYSLAIEEYFSSYTLSQPICFVRELNQKHRIGLNAVSNLAAFLSIEEGKITVQSNISEIIELDSRWNERLVLDYIDMLNVFYEETDFRKFFNNHKELYELAENNMNDFFSEFNINNWLESFFGNGKKSPPTIYLSLVNGPNNYAFPEGVLIGLGSDENGFPTPKLQTMSILIHEILHHYTNPLFDLFWDKMKDSANRIYPFVNTHLSNIHYEDAYNMTLEWLNRLFTLMCLKHENSDLYKLNTMLDMQNGFKWMQRSIDFMNNFEINRDRFKTIEEFMPYLVSFLEYVADNWEFIIEEHESYKPFITNIFPPLGNSIADFDKIIITFSQPMSGSYGFSGIPLECEPLPIDFENILWSDDKYSMIINLLPRSESEYLKYGVKLNPSAFQSNRFYNLRENVNYNLEFYK